MFCPNCGVKNLDDAKFCRSCGADIRLVPQAMSGQLPLIVSRSLELEEQIKEGAKKRKRKSKETPTLEKGLENVFVGIAFLIIFMLGLFYFRGALILWIWFIIPALACIGEGTGQVIRSRQTVRALPEGLTPVDVKPANGQNELPAADTSEIVMPPASVTEGTTRKLAIPNERAAHDS